KKVERFRAWKNAFYFPIVVLRNGKPWGSFDLQRLNVHIITRGDFERQVDSFLSILEASIPDVVIKNTAIKYVEICTRYDDVYFDIVARSIKKAEARFFTT